MALKLTVISRTINVRKAPKSNADLIKTENAGSQFDVIQVIDLPKSVEQWAKVVLPEAMNIDAYICTRLANGLRLCDVSNVPEPQPNDYNRGFMDGRQSEINRMIDFLKSE